MYIHIQEILIGIICTLLKRRPELLFFFVTIANKNALLLAPVKIKMSGM